MPKKVMLAPPENIMVQAETLVKIYRSKGVEGMALQGLDLTVERGELMGLIDTLKTEGGPEDGGYLGESTKNACFLLLFTLCYTIRSFGDLRIQGVSLFVHNIRYIKEEVRTELLRRQEGRYAFLGLTTLCLLPFFFSIPIQLWSASISADLNRFYTGTYGFVTLILCFSLTVICTVSVQELQYPTDRYAAFTDTDTGKTHRYTHCGTLQPLSEKE